MREEKIKRIRKAPELLEKHIREQNGREFYDAFLHQNDLYLVASLGQKSTSGYQVDIKNIHQLGIEGWEVIMEQKTPPKGKYIAQVITHPTSIVKVDLQDPRQRPKKIVFKNTDNKILQITQIEE